jgi:serine/threonine protein kinase
MGICKPCGRRCPTIFSPRCSSLCTAAAAELLKDNLYEFQRYLSEAGQPPYFTLGRLQRITRQVLTALAFMHERGLVHCDL